MFGPRRTWCPHYRVTREGGGPQAGRLRKERHKIGFFPSSFFLVSPPEPDRQAGPGHVAVSPPYLPLPCKHTSKRKGWRATGPAARMPAPP